MTVPNTLYWKAFLTKGGYSDSEKDLAFRKCEAWEFLERKHMRDGTMYGLQLRLENEIKAILRADTYDEMRNLQCLANITLSQVELRAKHLRIQRMFLWILLIMVLITIAFTVSAHEKREGYYKPPVLVASVSTVVAEETVMFENPFTIDVVTYNIDISVGLLNLLGDRVDKYTVEVIDRELGEIRYSITFDKRYQKLVDAYFTSRKTK